MLRSDRNDVADDSRSPASGILWRRRFRIFPGSRLGLYYRGFLAAGAGHRGRRLCGLSQDYPLGRTEHRCKRGTTDCDVAAVVSLSDLATATARRPTAPLRAITFRVASRAWSASHLQGLPARDAGDSVRADRTAPPHSCRSRSPAGRASLAPGAAPAIAVRAPAGPRLWQSRDEC